MADVSEGAVALANAKLQQGQPPKNRIFYARHHRAIKWTPYRPNSQEVKRGKMGRWQELRPFGIGWQNTEVVPEAGAWVEDIINRPELATRTAPPAVDREAVEKLVQPWADYHGDLPDYDHPLRPVYESGIQYAVELLAKELGVTDWTPCDGTEEFDGDLGGTMTNIVLEAMPKDKDGDPIHPRDLLSTLSADAIRQGEGSDQAFIFDVLEALKTHFPRIAFCFARGTGGIEREDVLAILNDTKTASGVGKATTEVAALVQWARDQMALPDGSGYLGGHIDENHGYKLRDLVNAIDATSWRLVQRTGLGDLPSRIQGWIGKARKQGRDRIELDFETVELLVRLATPASHASDGEKA